MASGPWSALRLGRTRRPRRARQRTQINQSRLSHTTFVYQYQYHPNLIKKGQIPVPYREIIPHCGGRASAFGLRSSPASHQRNELVITSKAPPSRREEPKTELADLPSHYLPDCTDTAGPGPTRDTVTSEVKPILFPLHERERAFVPSATSARVRFTTAYTPLASTFVVWDGHDESGVESFAHRRDSGVTPLRRLGLAGGPQQVIIVITHRRNG